MTSTPPPTAKKVGILIANLGTPDGYGYWPVRRYLSEFLSDKRVIDAPAWKWQPLLQLVILSKRPFSSGEAYKSIWNEVDNESPILTITKAQTAKLKTVLAKRYGDNVIVDFSMRYGNPSTKSKVQKMVQDGCDKILFFPLYPQYAGPTIAAANDVFFKALQEEKQQPAARTVAAYYSEPMYIEALAQSIETAYAKMKKRPDLLVASYHGMPKRYIAEGDSYLEHCQQTSKLLQERLGWDDGQLVTTFQSKFGIEEWLQPYTVEEVARLAKQGKKNIAIIAPAFSADCIETLEEIKDEIHESFEAAGGQGFDYIACLNDDDAHIAAFAKIIEDNLGGWLK